MYLLEGIRQIRVTPELIDGAADGSATPVVSTAIQQLAWAPVYQEGSQVINRGGDSIVAVVEEDDTFLGYQLTMDLAGLEPALKAAIAGGVVAGTKYSAPKDSTENPYPFRLEVWIANYEQSDSLSNQDGFIKFEFSFCKKGKFGSINASQQSFSNEQFTFIARKNSSNPSSIESALEHDYVTSIV